MKENVMIRENMFANITTEANKNQARLYGKLTTVKKVLRRVRALRQDKVDAFFHDKVESLKRIK